MSRSGVCYPQPGKARSREVLEAFAQGSGWKMRTSPAARLEHGGAAFYGVVGIEDLYRQAAAGSREYYYGDNAFFDRCRQKFFRFARNAFQISELAPPDHERRKALGIEVKPWRSSGLHIVVVEQSPHFMKLSGAGEEWLRTVGSILKLQTARPVRVRRWNRDKDKAARTLQADLQGAWALVTHMSAAANEALLAGVPVFLTGRCAATPMESGPLSMIEQPRLPDGREEWAAGLAAMQWTLDEMRAGMAWKALQ